MKTILALIIGLTTLTVSAQQNTPFVFRHTIKTNPPVYVKAEGVIAAHSVTEVIAIAEVAIVTEQGIVPFLQPAMHLISRTTNLTDSALLKKPLLSAQSPKASEPTTPAKAATKKMAGPPPAVNENSAAYKRIHGLPPYDKK